jgi:alanyl-tRNA synthetase
MEVKNDAGETPKDLLLRAPSEFITRLCCHLTGALKETKTDVLTMKKQLQDQKQQLQEQKKRIDLHNKTVDQKTVTTIATTTTTESAAASASSSSMGTRPVVLPSASASSASSDAASTIVASTVASPVGGRGSSKRKLENASDRAPQDQKAPKALTTSTTLTPASTSNDDERVHTPQSVTLTDSTIYELIVRRAESDQRRKIAKK